MDINNAIKRFVEPINYSAPNYVNRSYRVDMDIKTAENMLNHIADLEQRLAEAESRTCKWQEDSDTNNNLWNGECGAVWEFIADGPLENKCNFCPECGGKLVIVECPVKDSGKGE